MVTQKSAGVSTRRLAASASILRRKTEGVTASFLVEAIKNRIKSCTEAFGTDHVFVHAQNGNILSDGEATEDQPEREQERKPDFERSPISGLSSCCG